MNKKIVTILLISTAFLLNACQKNTDIFVPDAGQLNGADTTWNTTVPTTAPVFSLQSSLLSEPVRDSFEINANTVTITASNGLQITFPPLSCVTLAGLPVTGKVYVEARLVKAKGDMILLNKPTTSNGRMLVSGGEIFISISKNGQPLQLAPNVKIYVRYADAPTNQQMKLFFGDESVAGQFNWIPNTSTDTLGIGSQFYELAISHLRWINCDYFYDTATITRSQVSASLPSNYTNANTTAFLVFKDFRSVLRMNAEVPERRFITGKVPNGKAAVVVVISKQGNDYFLGKETITTGVNANTNNVQKVTVTPVKTSLADIRAYLATL
ncbi:hypothetical protein [Ferruginibacter sp. SUN106]|uniref:hypothetical protein n=1 Tax=Ferruginibacter sp. SUN106 TaxID=2978348 RepID=UPI003D367AD8